MSISGLTPFGYSSITNLSTMNAGSVVLVGLTPSRPVKTTAIGTLTSSQIGLSSTADVTGILPVANGGSGSGTALSGSKLMMSNGVQEIVEGTLTTTNVTATLGPATLALSIPQSVATSATPSFAGLTLNLFGNNFLLSTLAGGLVQASVSSVAPFFNQSVQSPSIILGPGSVHGKVAAFTTDPAASLTVTVPDVSAGTTTPNMALYSSLSSGALVQLGPNSLLTSGVSNTAPVFTASCSAPIVATNDLEIVATSTGNAGSMTVPSTLAQNTAYQLQDPAATVCVVMLAIAGSTYSDYAVATISAQTLLATPLLALNGTTYNGDVSVPATLGQTTTYTLPDPGQAASNIALANSSTVSLTWLGPESGHNVTNATNIFSISGNIASCSLAGLNMTIAGGTSTAAITNLGTEFPARYRPKVNQLVTSMVSTGVSANTAPSNIFISTGGLITINLAYGLTLWTTGCGWPSNMFLSWSLV